MYEIEGDREGQPAQHVYYSLFTARNGTKPAAADALSEDNSADVVLVPFRSFSRESRSSESPSGSLQLASVSRQPSGARSPPSPPGYALPPGGSICQSPGAPRTPAQPSPAPAPSQLRRHTPSLCADEDGASAAASLAASAAAHDGAGRTSPSAASGAELLYSTASWSTPLLSSPLVRCFDSVHATSVGSSSGSLRPRSREMRNIDSAFKNGMHEVLGVLKGMAERQERLERRVEDGQRRLCAKVDHTYQAVHRSAERLDRRVKAVACASMELLRGEHDCPRLLIVEPAEGPWEGPASWASGRTMTLRFLCEVSHQPCGKGCVARASNTPNRPGRGSGERERGA